MRAAQAAGATIQVAIAADPTVVALAGTEGAATLGQVEATRLRMHRCCEELIDQYAGEISCISISEK